MEKGMSSGEGLSQISAVKVTAKDLETKQPQKDRRGGFVLVHAGKLCMGDSEDEAQVDFFSCLEIH